MAAAGVMRAKCLERVVGSHLGKVDAARLRISLSMRGFHQSLPLVSMGYKVNHSSSARRSVIITMASKKIQLYSMATPNGQKVGVALEEMGLEYDPHLINIRENQNYSPEFTKINPNAKIPAIVDPDGPDGHPIAVFESGAILLYLAEKSGKFLSSNPRHRWETIQWVMFQMAGVGPMFGQFAHFYRTAKDKCLDPYPTERYRTEAMRLLAVVEKRLEGREFLIDDGYSIADMNLFPWIRFARALFPEKLELDKFPLVNAWAARCFARPASAKGTEVLSLGLPA
ncbi:hypothetical protein M758_10G102400 [Ceratodon purpureus]|nr:hypothetical protein M758_10G102400 [Ceratodon purpureus]